jgi:hypothetical protein
LQTLPSTFRCEADEGVKRLGVQQVLGHVRLLQVKKEITKKKILKKKMWNLRG